LLNYLLITLAFYRLAAYMLCQCGHLPTLLERFLLATMHFGTLCINVHFYIYCYFYWRFERR